MGTSAFLKLTAVTLVGLVVLVGLGVWQLQRLDWKQAVIARIEARTERKPGERVPKGTLHSHAVGKVSRWRRPTFRISCGCGAGKECLLNNDLAGSRRVPYGAKHRSAFMRRLGAFSLHNRYDLSNWIS